MSSEDMYSEKPVLVPLSLSGTHTVTGDCRQLSHDACTDSDILDNVTIDCLYCEEKFADPSERQHFLKHLLIKHNLVISDVNLIANFKTYINYWRKRFTEEPITEFCSAIKTNTGETDRAPSDLYYLLCDALPEDKQVRTKLQKERLDAVLAQQQKERTDGDFSRKCLFCKQHFTMSRSSVFDHMVQEHNFSVGKPDNLVYTDELLDMLDKHLHNLQCLYCEKVFKDRHVLKEHMRKKQHKKINPKNTKYDKFYVINYLGLGNNWESLQSEPEMSNPERDLDDASDTSSVIDEWSDWTEEGAQAVCLYCPMVSTDSDKVIQHMEEIHLFNLSQLKVELELSFYQQIKLINYVRRQMHQCVCPACLEKFESRDSLMDHMNFLGHVSQLPEKAVWDQPQYFFPTYENDALLCGLEDCDETDSGNASASDSSGFNVVIAEEFPVKDSILQEKALRDDLLSS